MTSVNVKNTGCGKGKKVVKAFNKCRHHNGGANGKCKSKVKGFKCDEGKRSGSPGVQYSAKVKCKNGGKKVVFGYTQSTLNRAPSRPAPAARPTPTEPRRTPTSASRR